MLEIGQEWLLWATPFRLKEVAAAPSGGEIIQDVVSLYAKDKAGTSHLYWQDDDGVEHDLEGNLFGSGTTNRLAYWSSSSTLAANAALTATRVMFADANGLPTDDADLTFATDTLTATKLTSTNVGIGGAPGSLPLEVYASANDTLTGIMIRSQASPTTRYGIATHQGGVFYFTSVDQAALDSEQSFIFRQHSLGSGTGREIGRFGPLGGLHVGSSGSSIALGVIDAATGYRVANAATSGNVLRGNGTNFVSAQLAHSDLSGLTTGDPHTQYALLAGRASGQTLIGGTASLEILTLQGSAHGDGGLIVLNNDTIISTASDVAAVKISPTFTGSSNVVRGIQSLPTFQPSASIGAAIAFSFAGIGDPATGKTISLLTGGAGAYQTGSSGGAVTDGYGFYVDSPTLGTVIPTSSTGTVIQNQGASGITNVYGLQIAAQTGGTNNYGHFLNIMSGNTSRALLIGASQLTDRHILAEIGGSWDTDSANAAGLYVTTTFTGQPSAAFGLVGIPTFTTEASTTTALAAANLSIARANPAGSATITTLAGGYFRCDYVSSTGAVTTGIALNVAPPLGFGTLRPITQYGLFISDQGLTGITNAVAARFELPTNATNVFYIEFPTADNTDPTSGGGAATGRIKCLIGGNTRYIPYYT